MAGRYPHFKSVKGAKAAVEKSAPNVQAEGVREQGTKAEFRAVAVLRPDQEYLRIRLEERGIMCVTAEQWAEYLAHAEAQQADAS